MSCKNIIFLGGNETQQNDFKNSLKEILVDSGYKVKVSNFCSEVKGKVDYCIICNMKDKDMLPEVLDMEDCNLVVFKNFECFSEQIESKILYRIQTTNTEKETDKIFDLLT